MIMCTCIVCVCVCVCVIKPWFPFLHVSDNLFPDNSQCRDLLVWSVQATQPIGWERGSHTERNELERAGRSQREREGGEEL